MIHVVMDYSWRHQYELMVSLILVQMVIYRNTYRCVKIEVLESTHISPRCQLGESRSKDTLVAMSTPGTQILVSHAGLLGRMADSKTGAGSLKDKPGAPCSARK